MKLEPSIDMLASYAASSLNDSEINMKSMSNRSTFPLHASSSNNSFSSNFSLFADDKEGFHDIIRRRQLSKEAVNTISLELKKYIIKKEQVMKKNTCTTLILYLCLLGKLPMIYPKLSSLNFSKTSKMG
jgi:hypothetical protein